MSALPIAVTMGEPAGIGGDITLKAWQRREHLALPSFFLIDDIDRLRSLGDRLGLTCPLIEIEDPAACHDAFNEGLPVLPLAVPLGGPIEPGHLNTANSASVISSIDQAVAFFFQGDIAALVTNPIHKSTLYGAGFTHPGHTEYLAELARAKTGSEAIPVMMLTIEDLRSVPATIHTPLREVPDLITEDRLLSLARAVNHSLIHDFGIPKPRLAIAGLNPHAGEDGSLGKEEQETIIPAIGRMTAEGLSVTGPHPADTLFHAEARMHYDVVIAMYHDQALIPIKTLDFYKGVNVTLGLPLIRTSPDHGTALDLAGTGRASPASLIEALYTARFIADTHARLAP